MPKPIGNQVANLATYDKVSHRIKSKFAAGAASPQPPRPATKRPKYKTRKK